MKKASVMVDGGGVPAERCQKRGQRKEGSGQEDSDGKNPVRKGWNSSVDGENTVQGTTVVKEGKAFPDVITSDQLFQKMALYRSCIYSTLSRPLSLSPIFF